LEEADNVGSLSGVCGSSLSEFGRQSSTFDKGTVLDSSGEERARGNLFPEIETIGDVKHRTPETRKDGSTYPVKFQLLAV
jgi:hypothetical protein